MPKPWCGVFRSGSIGDSIIASSPVALLAKKYNVELIVDHPYGSIWTHNPHVTKLTELPKGHVPPDPEWQKWMARRANEYAAFYNLSHSCEALIALSPNMSWFYWPASMRRKICDHNYLEVAHDVCEVPHDFTIGPRFYPSDEEVADAKRVKATVGERVIGVVLSGSRQDKVWPWMPNMIAKVLREYRVPIILFGGPGKDVEIADRIKDQVELQNNTDEGLHCCISKDTREVTVEWSMRRNLAQIAQCDLIISPDTGLAWSVAMLDMPKIMLLSHASPTNITKHWKNTITLHADQGRVPCWPCHQLHSEPETCVKAEKADAAACITDIHDTVVLDHIRRWMDHKPPVEVPWVGHNVLNDAPLKEGYVGLRRVDAAD